MMITHLTPAKAIRVVLFLTTAATAIVGSTTRNIVRKNEEVASSSSSVAGDSSSQQHRSLLGLNDMDCKEAVENDGSIVCRFRIMPPTTDTSSSSTNNPKTLVHGCLMRVNNFCITAEVYPYDHAYHQQVTAAAADNNNNNPSATITTATTTEQQQQQQDDLGGDDNGQEMIETIGGDPLPSFCAVDSDCNTSPDLAAVDFYCAAGTCLPQGGCFVDTDCVNPSNEKFKDTKCVGYVFCDTSVNRCDRKCTGFDCPGDVLATECTVTGCETRIGCPGSVNCVVDHCDANCKGLFFDSAGMVLEECAGGKGGGGSVVTIDAELSSAVIPPTAPADQEPVVIPSHSETIKIPTQVNGPQCPQTMPNNGSACNWVTTYQCGYFSSNEKPQLPGTYMMVCKCESNTNTFVCATTPKEIYYGVQSSSSF